MTTNDSTGKYRDHHVVVVEWMEPSGLVLAQVRRYLVAEHSDGRCTQRTEARVYMTEFGAMEEIDWCVGPVPPRPRSCVGCGREALGLCATCEREMAGTPR